MRKPKIFSIRKKNLYQPPGTLPPPPAGSPGGAPLITIIEYNETLIETRTGRTLSEVLSGRKKEGNMVTWINIEGIHHPGIVEEIGKTFSLHALTLEDIMSNDQRPKLEFYDEYDMAVMKMVYELDQKVYAEQLTIIIADNTVITFQEYEGKDAFDHVRQRLNQGSIRIRKMGADYLAYSLMDCVVDAYFSVLDRIGEKLEEMDEQVVLSPRPELLQHLYYLKRETIALRKSVWPMREMLNSMERTESRFVTQNTAVFFRDLLDHTLRVSETIETNRDLISGMMDLYMSTMSNKMNEIMKVLTILSSIFIPVTFIAGVYGMNFDFMPELHSPIGYGATWGVMILIMLGMLFYFWRKKWL